MSDIDLDFIRSKINQIFPTNKYNIRDEKSFNRLAGKEYDTFYISDKRNDNCIEFEIFKDVLNKLIIHINHLNKCAGGSGTFLLNSIDELAKLVDVKIIRLEDGSRINDDNCRISYPLKTLYILTTGRSWYNSLGYMLSTENPDTTQEEIDINHEMLINMNIVDFINLCKIKQMEKYKDNLYKKLSEEEKEKKQIDNEIRITDEIQHILQKLDSYKTTISDLNTDLNVKDYFKFVKDILKNSDGNNCDTIEFLSYLIEFINNSGILYPRTGLEKQIVSTSATISIGGKNKCRRKSRKSKRKRKSRKSKSKRNSRK